MELLTVWEQELKKRSFSEIIFAVIGIILGLIIAFLISQPIYKIPIPYVGMAISIILYGILGYLGFRTGLSYKDDLSLKIRDLVAGGKKISKDKGKIKFQSDLPKVLDTSVIIDGRILDITKSGFVEGTIVIPVFVLEELQHIADSSDSLKRKRGRRGLDIVKEMQGLENANIVIEQSLYEDISEVDSKLLKLTSDLNGKIVTNDYNLNKVALVQNIPVLNINELANAVKPVYLPGEEMEVQIIKTGKELNQGLGYLDDGTMIVIENGKHLIGKTVNVTVTSALQTSAGKMIFAKPN
ncbi:PIN domain-containing protein [uncultured Peptoniphilus sp.]|uniref:PIN/TRAM domain-containing protein n=1 Tax=uncultured Peptoniphilus sp. TaxID=254354 RepID=UPI0028044523|nr:PIN domain-containing protein [uncultured Peptoniphilus sp.]